MSTEDHPDWWRPMGGQNSQDSTLERRSLIWNDGDPVAPAAPPAWLLATSYWGKFFTRGCRGIIHRLGIYCIRTAAGTLDLSIAPYPGMGPTYIITITPGAAWAWVYTAMQQMWNYDSLFIWISRCDADVSWGWDQVLPHDDHRSPDAGVTWIPRADRMYVRAEMRGETPGDVPVSGTINVIEIPSIASRMETAESVNVPHGISTEILEIEGAGTLLEASLTFETSVIPTAGDAPAAVMYGIYFFADGVLAYFTQNRMLTQSYVAVSGRCAIGEFYQGTVADPQWDETEMTVRLPVKFRRSLVIRAYQSTGVAVDVYGIIVANLNR